MQHKLFFPLAFLLSFVIFFSPSCRRNKDCELIVFVTDGNTNGPIVGATVHIYPNQPGNTLPAQDQTSTTDASGTASFIFKLPAILKADVTPPPKYTATSKLVTLEEGKTVNSTIKVY